MSAFRNKAMTPVAFGLLVLVNGGVSVAIKLTFVELEPFSGAAVRFFLGALIFWSIAFLQGLAFPSGKALLGSVLYGFFAFGGAIILLYWGLTKTSASLYQIIIALVPLLTLFLARVHRIERIRPKSVFGSVLAVVGISIAVSNARSQEVSIPHLIAILGAAACFAEAGIVAKLYPGTDLRWMNAVGMTVGAGMLGVLALLRRESWLIPVMPSTWIAFAYIVIMATFLAYILHLVILKQWTASATAYSYVLVPFVTVLLDATLAGTEISPGFIAGGIVVSIGVFYGIGQPET